MSSLDPSPSLGYFFFQLFYTQISSGGGRKQLISTRRAEKHTKTIKSTILELNLRAVRVYK